MTTDKLICAVESGKYEGATFVVGKEYIMESTHSGPVGRQSVPK